MEGAADSFSLDRIGLAISGRISLLALLETGLGVIYLVIIWALTLLAAKIFRGSKLLWLHTNPKTCKVCSYLQYSQMLKTKQRSVDCDKD
jgi:hypothetical protein